MDLGAGPAFGSKQVENNVELRWQEIETDAIDIMLRARVLVFDWWISNSDRQLGELGGNPNLLWTQSDARLHLIDHNLAFPLKEDSSSLFQFAQDHVFGRDLLYGEGLFFQEESPNLAHLNSALKELKQFWQDDTELLSDIWEDIPMEWIESIPEDTFASIQKFLGRIHLDKYSSIRGFMSADRSEDGKS